MKTLIRTVCGVILNVFCVDSFYDSSNNYGIYLDYDEVTDSRILLLLLKSFFKRFDHLARKDTRVLND
jgi:hypothetical protein